MRHLAALHTSINTSHPAENPVTEICVNIASIPSNFNQYHASIAKRKSVSHLWTSDKTLRVVEKSLKLFLVHLGASSRTVVVLLRVCVGSAVGAHRLCLHLYWTAVNHIQWSQSMCWSAVFESLGPLCLESVGPQGSHEKWKVYQSS